MVVSEHPLATQAGVAILELGGNAADAAVATALALAVALPQAGNLGGGGFAVWVSHDPALDPKVLDFRETAPMRLSARDFLDEDGKAVPERSLVSHLAVGVPGSPQGLATLQAEHGLLSRVEVAAPAIALAREGILVDRRLAEDLARPENRTKLERSAMAGTIFYPRGEPLAEGALLRQENLAETLETWARDGPRAFYEGDVAAAILAEMGRGGGKLDPEDLLQYGVIWREALRGWFRGLEIVTVPPPSSGGLALLQVLGILDGFPLDEERERVLAGAELEGAGFDAVPGLSGRAVHWWIEAMRRAFADRAQHLGDPGFHDVPVDELLAPEWIAERRVSIGELARAGVAAMPLPVPGGDEGGQTTHLSVIDREGNAVSLTTTLNTNFGSGIMVPGAGFLLNNEIDDFSIVSGEPNFFGLVGGEANAIRGGKRPLSSMTPTVVRDGGQTVRMVLGSPGGPRIITAVIQVILRTEVYGQTLAAAVAAPRLHQQWAPAKTTFEKDWGEALLRDLRNRGHQVEVLEEKRFGSVQAIRLEVGGEPEGASDPRWDGAALGERLGGEGAEVFGGELDGE